VRAEPGDAWEWTQSFDGMSIKDNDNVIVNSDIVIHDHNNVIIILLSFQQAQLARTGREGDKTKTKSS
jgi:hypothetical protein